MSAFELTIRLRPVRRHLLAVDLVLPKHEWIDGELARWGRWSLAKRARLRCGSAEGAYRAPWRQWHAPTIAELMPPVDRAEMIAIDRAVMACPGEHKRAVRLHYVARAPGDLICRRINLRFEAFAQFMGAARSMVLNQLRRQEGA